MPDRAFTQSGTDDLLQFVTIEFFKVLKVLDAVATDVERFASSINITVEAVSVNERFQVKL